MIPQSFIQDLLARLDIVEVVERYVKLKKAGASHVACCPFHSEKTPSFSVSPSKQFYHCFGCGAHGSAVNFVMEYSGMGFVDAVKELAASVGMAVPHDEGGFRSPDVQKAPLTELMERVARFYHDALKSAPKAVQYLKARGVSGEIAARYGIGYAPEGWQTLQDALTGVAVADLLDCGLIIENESGRRYDRFRDRIMFPIHDGRGRVIAFGGRVLGDGEPKYLNSPETALFEKGRELYGIAQARNGIRDADTVVVVEGYMDVVALAQHGVNNAVATLGTATTPTHIHKLLRVAKRIVFCFDGDAAGRKAAKRALEASLESVEDDKALAFLFLPASHDPDSYVREHGAEGFVRMMNEAGSMVDFFIQELRKSPDRGTSSGNARLLAEAKPVLERIRAPRLRAQIAHTIVGLTGLVASSPREAERTLGLTPMAGGPRAAPRGAARRAPPSLLRALLRLVVRHPEWCAALPHELIPPGDAEGETLRALADAVDHGELPSGGLGTVLEFFRGTPHEGLLAEIVRELALESADEPSFEAVFNDTIDQLRRANIHQEISALSTKERSTGLSADERRRLAALLSQKQRGGIVGSRAPSES